MPINYLKELFEKFAKNFEKLDLSIPSEKRIHDYFVTLSERFTSFVNLTESTLILENNNQNAISSEELETYRQAYSNVTESYREIRKLVRQVEKEDIFLDVDIINATLTEACEMSNIGIVLDFYSNEMKKIQSNAEAQKQPIKLTNILANHGWVDLLLQKDTDLEAWVNSKLPSNNMPIKDKLKKSYEFITEYPAQYKKHMPKVANNVNVEESLQIKKNLIEEALGEEAKKHPVVQYIENQESFNPDSISALLNPKNWTEETEQDLEKKVEQGLISGPVYSTLMNTRMLFHIEPFITEFIQKQYPFEELDLKKMNINDRFYTLMSNVNRLQKKINKYLSSLKDPSLEDSEIRTSELMDEDELLDYIGYGEDGASIDTDFGNVIDSIMNYAEQAGPYSNETGVNYFAFKMVKMASKIAEKIPELHERFVTSENNFVQSIQRTLNRMYLTIEMEENISTAVIRDALNKVHSLLDNNYISEDVYDKFYYTCLIKNADFRKEERRRAYEIATDYSLEKEFDVDGPYYGIYRPAYRQSLDQKHFVLKNLTKTMMYCDYLDKEVGNAANRNQRVPQALFDQIHIDRNPAFDTVNEKGVIEPGTSDAMQESRRNLLNGPAFKALTNGSNEAMMQYLRSENHELNYRSITDGEVDQLVPGMGDDLLKALTQKSGNLGSSNSEQYNNIGKALLKLSQSAHRGGGVKASDYEDLYDSLIAYMRSHNSEPGSTNGKLRLYAVSEMAAVVGLKLMSYAPEKKDQVMHDFRVQMLRNKVFHDACVKYCKQAISDNPEIKNGLNHTKYEALSNSLKAMSELSFMTLRYEETVLKGLNADHKSGMIKGYCKTLEEENALLEQYAYASESVDRMKGIFANPELEESIELTTGKAQLDTKTNLDRISENVAMLRDYFIRNRELFTEGHMKDNGDVKKYLANMIGNRQFLNKFSEPILLPAHYNRLEEVFREKSLLEKQCSVIANSEVLERLITEIGEAALPKIANHPTPEIVGQLTELYETLPFAMMSEEKMGEEKSKEATAKVQSLTNRFKNLSSANPFAQYKSRNNTYVNTIRPILEELPFYVDVEMALKMFKEAEKEKPLISYDEFRAVIEPKNDTEICNLDPVSEEERNARMALRDKAMENLIRGAFNIFHQNGMDKEKEALGGCFRTIYSFNFASGEKDKKQCENNLSRIAFGTVEEKKKAFKESLERFLNTDMEIFNKSYSDEELATEWPKIFEASFALGMEYENYITRMKEMTGSGPDAELQKKLNQVVAVAKPFYSYYSMRMARITGEYSAYLPMNMEDTSNGFEYENVMDEADICDSNWMRTITGFRQDFSQGAVYEYIVRTQEQKQGASINALYLEDGTSLDYEFIKAGKAIEQMNKGKKLIMFFEGKPEPYVVQLEEGSMPPKVKEHDPKLYKDVAAPSGNKHTAYMDGYEIRQQGKATYLKWIKEEEKAAGAEVKSALLERKDGKLVESLSKQIYLKYIQQRNEKQELDFANLEQEIGTRLPQKIEELKPCVAAVLTKMPEKLLESSCEKGNLSEVVERAIRLEYNTEASRTAALREYQENLAQHENQLVLELQQPKEPAVVQLPQA